ncbi:hypothetical protein ACSBR1_027105 [Camellia fascicularis]
MRLMSTDFKKQIDGIEMLHKSGHNIEKVQEKMRKLVKQIIHAFSATKTYPYVFEGTQSSIICLQIVGQLKSLQLVASLTAERDGEIRKAALNTLATGGWNNMEQYCCLIILLLIFCRDAIGLQEKIKLVPIDLQNRPDWYKEKVYPPNKVPSLEHNNEIRGESPDLLKYIDSYFEGPALYPDLLSYTNTFNLAVITSLKGGSENEISTAFDYLESALFKFTDGPFFLGQFSLVDIAYAPFIERFYPLLLDVKKYDITTGRPMLTSWIEVHYLSLPFCAELLLCGCQPTSNSNSNC